MGLLTTWKVSKYRAFSGPYFLAFGLYTERYGVSLPIQSECGQIRTRKNSVFGHFSHSDWIIIFGLVGPTLFIQILEDKVGVGFYLVFMIFDTKSKSCHTKRI